MNLKKVPQQDYEPAQHGPVFNFLYSLKTHFLTIMSVNFLFLVFNIPMMLVAFGFSLVFLPYMNSVFEPTAFAQFMYDSGVVGNEAINDVGADAAFQIYYLIVLFCVMFLLGSTLLVIGPFQAGFSQIYRNFYRQEGVFLFNDFKEGLIRNWKQSLGASVISLVFTAVDLLAIGFYLNTGTRFGTIAATVFVLLFFMFIVIQNMVYTMIVSREISLPKIYKNAFLFFLMKFGPCLGLIFLLIVMLIVIPAMLMVTTTYFAYALVVIYYLTLVFGIIQYTFAYFTGELINEYIEPLSPTPEPEYEDEFGDDDDDGTPDKEEEDGEPAE
ncbi:MAG: hypothetical protein K6F79_04250 [Saccharofermentans sp.]|nr:hypothetical protein [Saccharofermentans sp.]